jgi:Rrf2 family transcriptional regulator, cysteine metabolism repressor
MKVSTKGRYGLETLLDLTIHSAEGSVNISSISERCGISEAYIMQIFHILRHSGIISSIRGAQGGFILSKKAKNITVGEVLILLEGPLSPVDCITPTPEEKEPCSRFPKCVTRVLWERIMNDLTNLVNSITIEDLVKSYYEMKCPPDQIDYYI